MARAVNQTIAWIVALFLSLVVFGIGLAIVFSLKPGHKADDHGASNEHGAAHDTHKAHDSIPEQPADSESAHARPKIEHEDPHAKDGQEAEKEITPASVKAKSQGQSPDAHPHH